MFLGTHFPKVDDKNRYVLPAKFREELRGGLVIAKGQGNFESLSEVDRDIFFLLTIKCPVAAQHMAKLTGLTPERLPGKGEMAVYYSPMNIQP